MAGAFIFGSVDTGDLVTILSLRRGKWKLVLNGQLVEEAPAEDEVHLSNLEEGIGEKVNLKEEEPEVTEELKQAAEIWRAGIEERWEREFAPEK